MRRYMRPSVWLHFRVKHSGVLDVLLEARIDQLALHQVQRGLVVQSEIAERVSQDLGHPHQAGLDVADEEQVHGPEQQPADPDRQPDLGDLAHEISRRGPGRKHAEQGRIEEQHQRRKRPDRHQDDLSVQIIADLDFLLVVVGRMVDVIVALWLEEEVTRLPGRHRDQPADQRGSNRINEQQWISDQKAGGTDKVQALVDAAVMVVAMVVPPLSSQLLAEILDHFRPPSRSGSRSGYYLPRFDVRYVTTS